MTLNESSSIGELGELNNDELFQYFLNDELGHVANDSPYSLPPLSPDPLDLEMHYTSSPMDSSMPILKEEFDEVPRVIASVKQENKNSKSSSRTSPSPSSSSSSSSVLNSEEERQLKRQRRLVKNRESAQLSRMRKKIYMEDLENKINALTSENSALKGEVAHLQHIIKQMTTTSKSDSSIVCANSNKNVALRVSPPSRNAQAGICLLIVLFSLGLLVNVVGHGHGNVLRVGSDSLRVQEPLPRARRDTSPVLSIMNSSEKKSEKNHMVDMWEDVDDIEPGEAISDHSLKRALPEDDEDEECLPSRHKRARFRAASAESEDEEEHEEHTDEHPVAIALLVPPHPRHHPPEEVSQMLSSFMSSQHRVLNVHVWPLSR